MYVYLRTEKHLYFCGLPEVNIDNHVSRFNQFNPIFRNTVISILSIKFAIQFVPFVWTFDCPRWSLWWSRCFKSWFRTDFSELHPVKKYSQPCVPNTSNTKSIALFMIHHGQDPSRMMIFVWRWVALWLWLPMLEELGHQLVTSPPLCYTSAGRCLLWCGVEGSGILSVA